MARFDVIYLVPVLLQVQADNEEAARRKAVDELIYVLNPSSGGGFGPAPLASYKPGGWDMAQLYSIHEVPQD
jgi:hypothetical protein